jgi:transglutaminase-like putative cysteine protease
MNKNHRHLTTSLLILLNLTMNSYAQHLPPDIKVSNPRDYDVTFTTKFVVPGDGKRLGTLRVWHALPTSRPWDSMDRTLGASAITYQPDSGGVHHLADNESQHVLWELRKGLTAGKKFEFVSQFRVRSADRTFDYQSSTAKWSDYYYSPHNLERFAYVDDEHTALVEQIKKTHSPAETALEICKWITAHIKYDASVAYHPADVASTLRFSKGHCGHQMELFRALCSKAGIPTRSVYGLNLRVPGGVGPLHKTRPDFENQHTWAQVYLPGSGWVEIDPGAGKDAYTIPSQLIQNSTDFQNYVIWIEENGQWKQPEWLSHDGKWFSPYGVESLRTFRLVKSK